MLDIISWIIFGAIAGFLTSKISKTSMDKYTMTIVGIVGSAIGGFLGNFLGLGSVSGFTIGSFILAIIGSLILLYIVNKVTHAPTNKRR